MANPSQLSIFDIPGVTSSDALRFLLKLRPPMQLTLLPIPTQLPLPEPGDDPLLCLAEEPHGQDTR